MGFLILHSAHFFSAFISISYMESDWKVQNDWNDPDLVCDWILDMVDLPHWCFLLIITVCAVISGYSFT